MPVSVVIGGQFGSEGKGKVSHFFAKKLNAVAVVRVGGANSGHTVVDNYKKYVFRSLPTVAVDRDIVSILPSGAYIDFDILKKEIEMLGVTPDRLKIDPYAVIIDNEMKQFEVNEKLRDKIGSTLSGTGGAVLGRVSRTSKIVFAKDIDKLQKYVCDTKAFMRGLLNADKHIIIEGTQGFGLSPLNAEFYPFCTSRDTTAAAFVSEAGLSPLDVANVIMVIRAFPIRVGGNSGALANETDWNSISKACGAGIDLTEYTSATNRIRRVGEFDEREVKAAICVNRPNIIVLNHVDYVDYGCHNKEEYSAKVRGFVSSVEDKIRQKIDYIGSGSEVIAKNI